MTLIFTSDTKLDLVNKHLYLNNDIKQINFDINTF
mgnify:CR=1 FL=1